MSGEPSIWDSVQPYYAAYCQTHGAASPAEMKARDAIAYPNAKAMGFVLWINQQWRDWRVTRGYASCRILLDVDHADFSAWLSARCGASADQVAA